MERGLPPNGVVPLLKEKVDGMKNKVPVITNLRNQSLKARHWEVRFVRFMFIPKSDSWLITEHGSEDLKIVHCL